MAPSIYYLLRTKRIVKSQQSLDKLTWENKIGIVVTKEILRWQMLSEIKFVIDITGLDQTS